MHEITVSHAEYARRRAAKEVELHINDSRPWLFYGKPELLPDGYGPATRPWLWIGIVLAVIGAVLFLVAIFDIVPVLPGIVGIMLFFFGVALADAAAQSRAEQMLAACDDHPALYDYATGENIITVEEDDS